MIKKRGETPTGTNKGGREREQERGEREEKTDEREETRVRKGGMQ